MDFLNIYIFKDRVVFKFSRYFTLLIKCSVETQNSIFKMITPFLYNTLFSE